MEHFHRSTEAHNSHRVVNILQLNEETRISWPKHVATYIDMATPISELQKL